LRINNAHAAVNYTRDYFLGDFETENYQDLLYMHGTCIHLYSICLLPLAQTSSNNVQEIIEGKVEKRTKG